QLLRFYHACERDRERREAVATAIIFTGVLTAVAILPADALRQRLSFALFGTAAYAPLLRLAFWSMVSSNVLAAALAYLRARPMIGGSRPVFAVNGADRVVLAGVGSFTEVGVSSLANRFAMTLLVFVITPFSYFWAAERFAVAKQPGGRAVIARVFTYFFVVL